MLNKKTKSTKKVILKKDAHGNRKEWPDLSCVSQIFAADFFGISSVSLGMWECPRNDDRSYDLKAVVAWKVKKEAEGKSKNGKEDFEVEKLRLQCQKLEMDIETQKKNTIPISEHREFLAARAGDLKDFLMGYGKMNLHEIAGQPVDVCQKYWDRIVRGAMNTYVKERS